jgi:hypothetical protein
MVCLASIHGYQNKVLLEEILEKLTNLEERMTEIDTKLYELETAIIVWRN